VLAWTAVALGRAVFAVAKPSRPNGEFRFACSANVYTLYAQNHGQVLNLVSNLYTQSVDKRAEPRSMCAKQGPLLPLVTSSPFSEGTMLPFEQGP
jgi:hypothetical protein